MSLFRKLAAALTLSLWLLGVGAGAQTSEPATAPSEANALPSGDAPARGTAGQPSGAIAVDSDAFAVGPDIFLLPDESGKLRRVLGYRYEDFLHAWRSADGDSDDTLKPPRFVAESLKIEVAATAESAEVRATLTARLHSTAWVEIPLELGALIVESATIGDGGEQEFVRFDAGKHYFTAWVKGKPGDIRTITLNGQVPLQRQGEVRRLVLDLPAAASSVVSVDSPAAPFIESPESALVASTREESGASALRLEGAKGRLQLRWGEAAADATEDSYGQLLEAAVDALVHVEPGRLSYDVRITLAGAAEPIERVQLRLPPGMVASIPTDATDYEIAQTITPPSADASSVVELAVVKPAVQPPILRLVLEPDGSGAPRGPVFRANAIEVLGAFRQHGTVAIRVTDQLHAHFESQGRAERIAASDLPEALRVDLPLAAFTTVGSNWFVDVYTQPRQRKILVTPSYAIHFGPEDATLDVVLDYQISGGSTFDLRVDLNNWKLTDQPIEAGGAVDLAGQHVTPEGTLILPLKDTEAEQLRIRFALRRPVGHGSHDLSLPTMQNAGVLPGSLSIASDVGWQSMVQIENSKGIAPADDPTGVAPAAPEAAARNGRGTSVQRFETYLPQVVVAVDVSEQPQSIAVQSIAAASLGDERLQVEQQLIFDIAHQPASEVTAVVPTELLSNEGLTLLLDEKPMGAAAVEVAPLSTDDAGAAASVFRMAVRLPSPTLGRVTLTIQSTARPSEAQLSGRQAITIPLATALDEASNMVTLKSSLTSRSLALTEPSIARGWVALDSVEKAAADRPATLTAIANKSLNEISLVVRTNSAIAKPEKVRVVASWVQTWLSGGIRQDRFVYRFETRGSEIVLLAPVQLHGQPLEALLDGQVIPIDVSQPGRMLVKLPGGEGSDQHVLELRRISPYSLGTMGQIEAAIPKVEGSSSGRPFFWQLVTPRELTAIGVPDHMSPEYLLGWQGLYWGRQPTQSQGDLERWSGSQKAPSPPATANEYLYSGFEPPAEVRVLIIRRLWIVVVAGFVALGVGLLWLHTAAGRSTLFWSIVCIAAVALLLSYPEAAVLLVQAAAIGVAFTATSALTQWLLADTNLSRAVPVHAASSIASLAATQSWVADPGPESSAKTAPTLQSSGLAP